MTGNAFLAVPLSDEKRHEIAASLSQASPGFPMPGRRVNPDNWHVTVRFLGECDPFVLDSVAATLDESLEVEGGRATIVGLGAFPKAARAGIVYAALDDDGTLDQLSARCEELVRDIGFVPDERPFVPHITLSRLRPRIDVTRLLDRFGPLSVRLPVDTVVLYETTRTPAGLRYVARHEVGLA